ncbi:pectinesterase inhibitor-like [Olea europaea subsp. europaea]|uniref:Pectinesterase inhibitor-like n=1 Tax=Olea europaea subsp. europaea TaxID=158383 RepID=A0A8S0U5Z1_OLEEU|nr:pectinesterase inhibitor-like [Olea europaea subsp. europaea]
MSKFFIPLALLFCLGFHFTVISAKVGALPPSSSSLSGSALIRKACQGVNECVSILESAPENQKADANGLIFFALRFAEDQSANFTQSIVLLTAQPDQAPMVQSSLTDCIDQLNPVGDLIEDAINAVFAGVYRDAIKFLEAAFGDVDTCSTLLKNRIADKSDPEVHVELPDNVLALSSSLNITLSAALNLLKA